MAEPWQTVVLTLLALGAWVAWWLGAVNWAKLWPALARGGWAPAVLLGLVVAAAWARATPGEFLWLGVVRLPNFLGQLLAVAGLAALARFCGWLQGRFHWAPPEVAVEPPADSADGHGHAHH